MLDAKVVDEGNICVEEIAVQVIRGYVVGMLSPPHLHEVVEQICHQLHW
jgi:hypothetical protein